LTKIRKAEGNLEALVQDLHKALNLGEEERKMKNRMERKAKNRVYEAPEPLIWINPLTKHIVIRGHHRKDVEKFIASIPEVK